MIFIAALLNFYPWLYVLKMDPDLDPKRRQTITNTVDYPINSENLDSQKSAKVLWRVAIAATRRNKGAWSSLGLGLSLGDFLGDTLGDIPGDILAKYGASSRERVVQLL
jgi:hypothetical protein